MGKKTNVPNEREAIKTNEWILAWFLDPITKNNVKENKNVPFTHL